MPFGTSVRSSCCVCGQEFDHKKKLSEHIKKEHKIEILDYYVKYYCSGERPICPVCGGVTRFVSLGDGFKKYCQADRKIAESLAGSIGGKIKKNWNKGKTKETDIRLLELSKAMSGENNPFFGKSHTDESKKKNADARRLNFDTVLSRISKSNEFVAVLSTHEDYVDHNTPLHVSCKTCGTLDEVSLFNITRCWRCKTCFPLGSRQQLELEEYVKNLGFEVVSSTKKVIYPYELDIFVPSKQIAIEYHGLYWHSGGREETYDKYRHRRKYELCRDKGIKLIQIFSDVWIEKNEICKSIVSNALGVNTKKLNARDCAVVELDKDVAKEFLDNTHISGYTRCTQRFGLMHKSEGLVGIATTRTPIQKKWGHVCELARMSFVKNTSVRGGASKLLCAVKKHATSRGFDGVLSYADLMLGEGDVYKKCGFSLVGESLNNYWYTDGHKRFDRFAYRAKPGKSEKEVALEEGLRAIWGCGNKVYLWKSGS